MSASVPQKDDSNTNKQQGVTDLNPTKLNGSIFIPSTENKHLNVLAAQVGENSFKKTKSVMFSEKNASFLMESNMSKSNFALTSSFVSSFDPSKKLTQLLHALSECRLYACVEMNALNNTRENLRKQLDILEKQLHNIESIVSKLKPNATNNNNNNNNNNSSQPIQTNNNQSQNNIYPACIEYFMDLEKILETLKTLLEKVHLNPLFGKLMFGKSLKKRVQDLQRCTVGIMTIFSFVSNQNFDECAQARELADMYFYGSGGFQNYKIALKLYKRAGILQDPRALYHLGLMYYEGLGVTVKKPEKSFMYLKASASLKNPDSSNQLGIFYEMGVLKEDSLDSLEAAERAYYVAAIEQQHSDMSKTLGPILHTLISPTKISKEETFTLSLGRLDSCVNLANLSIIKALKLASSSESKKPVLDEEITPSGDYKSEKEVMIQSLFDSALFQLKTALDFDYPRAKTYLGLLKFFGLGKFIPKDRAGAVELLKASASNTAGAEWISSFFLSLCYFHGFLDDDNEENEIFGSKKMKKEEKFLNSSLKSPLHSPQHPRVFGLEPSRSQSSLFSSKDFGNNITFSEEKQKEQHKKREGIAMKYYNESAKKRHDAVITNLMHFYWSQACNLLEFLTFSTYDPKAKENESSNSSSKSLDLNLLICDSPSDAAFLRALFEEFAETDAKKPDSGLAFKFFKIATQIGEKSENGTISEFCTNPQAWKKCGDYNYSIAMNILKDINLSSKILHPNAKYLTDVVEDIENCTIENALEMYTRASDLGSSEAEDAKNLILQDIESRHLLKESLRDTFF